MTVSTQVSRNEYTGNGATTQYDFTFRILDKSHLLVQTLDTSESIVTLTLGTDYTVTGVNRYNGGKVVLTSALPTGYKISIERSTPVTQEASIRNQGGFFPEIHEDAFDKLTMLVQQAYGWWSGLSLRKPSWLANYYDALNNRIRNLRDPSQAQDAATKRYTDVLYNDAIIHADENFNKSVRVTDSSIPSLPGIASRRNKILAFNNEGNPIVVLPESGSAADVLIELGSSAIPGSSLVMHSDGKTVQQYINILNRRTNFVMPEDFPGTDTEQLLAANSYAKANSVNFQLQPGKTYVLTGSVGLDIDLGYFSFGCAFGRAGIDATGFTGDAAIWVHSSAPYSLGYRVHSNIMRGVSVVGSLKGTGQAGIITGNKNNNANGTYNGDCNVIYCSFKNFDKLLLATNSTWRYKFTDCGFTTELTGTTHAMHFPSGLLDSGESVSFNDCKIYDTKGAPILLECANFAIAMPGTSILNCPVEVTGAGAFINLNTTSNIENPLASGRYRYVKVTGVAARFNFNGCTIVCNNPSVQTQPLFEVGVNAFLDFSHVKMPGNNYPFQNGPEGFRTFVEGDGYVIAHAVINDIASGVGNIPLHKSLNPTRNFGFGTGDLSSWSFNNQGSVSQTCVVDAAYKKTGSYGARMTSIGSLSCYLTQNVKVTGHTYFTTSLIVRTVTPGSGTTAGQLTVTFYDRAGVKIQDGPSSTFSNSVTDWVSVGQFVQGRVLQSAEYCEVSVRCREGAVIDVDSFIINFT